MRPLTKKSHGVLFFVTLVLFLISGGILGVFVYGAVNHQRLVASTVPCAVSDKLVNECRPWFGATAYGYPQVASDNFSQFKYLEQRIGRQIDVYHEYNGVGSVPFTSGAKAYMAARPSGIVYANWKPASKWKDAAGGNTEVNKRIDKAADAFKAQGNRKFFLTLHAEPENDVTPGTTNVCGNRLKGSFGSPEDYRAMWQNVRKRFDAKGVKNVVWTMNYMGYSGWDCIVNVMWPGNNLVDWITYDQYGYKNDTADTAWGRFYKVLEQKSSSATNYISKPWGIGEFSAYDMTQAQAYRFYDSLADAVKSNKFPRLKMYLVFDHTNPDPYLRIAYGKDGKYDPEEQRHFNLLANAPIFLTNTRQVADPKPAPSDADGDGVVDSKDQCPNIKGLPSTGCPEPTTTPAEPPVEESNNQYSGDNPDFGSLDDANDNIPTDNDPSLLLDHEEIVDDFGTGNDDDSILQATANVEQPTEPGQNPTVSGTVQVINPHGDTTVVKVDGSKVAEGSKTATVDTTCLQNGTQVVSVSGSNGRSSSTQTVNIKNDLSTWQTFRNEFCAQLGGNRRTANVVAGTFVGAPLLGLATLAWVGWRWLRLKAVVKAANNPTYYY